MATEARDFTIKLVRRVTTRRIKSDITTSAHITETQKRFRGIKDAFKAETKEDWDNMIMGMMRIDPGLAGLMKGVEIGKLYEFELIPFRVEYEKPFFIAADLAEKLEHTVCVLPGYIEDSYYYFKLGVPCTPAMLAEEHADDILRSQWDFIEPVIEKYKDRIVSIEPEECAFWEVHGLDGYWIVYDIISTPGNVWHSALVAPHHGDEHPFYVEKNKALIFFVRWVHKDEEKFSEIKGRIEGRVKDYAKCSIDSVEPVKINRAWIETHGKVIDLDFKEKVQRQKAYDSFSNELNKATRDARELDLRYVRNIVRKKLPVMHESAVITFSDPARKECSYFP